VPKVFSCGRLTLIHAEKMNGSSTAFDGVLMEIPHFKSFPAMLPFVGQDYLSSSHPKLLICAESFYFPEDSVLHKDSAKWYSINQHDLDEEEEVGYIHCRNLLECAWVHPGHAIYRELNRCLEEIELPDSDRAISHIAFMNTFFRPAAHEGESFQKCCVPEDFGVSI